MDVQRLISLLLWFTTALHDHAVQRWRSNALLAAGWQLSQNAIPHSAQHPRLLFGNRWRAWLAGLAV
jgi:hypothetical protein